MHDLATIQRMNAEAEAAAVRFTEADLDELLHEWDELTGDVDGFYQKWTDKINSKL